MKFTFICHHCDKTLSRDPRIKKQKYCSSRACQNTRRLTSNKVRAKKSLESRLLRKDRNKRWRDTYPADEYQKDYRENHPKYVKRNSDLQRDRNKKRQNESTSMIVKTYAIAPQPLRDGVYVGFEVKNKKIVKTYAYMAQRQSQPGLGAVFPSNPV
jgi:hypothetical protein